jgi:hypothetical protein
MGRRDEHGGKRRKKSDKRREKFDRQGKFNKKGVRIFLTIALGKSKSKSGGKRK